MKAPLAALAVLLVGLCGCDKEEQRASAAAAAERAAASAAAQAADLDPTELGAFAPLPEVMTSDKNPIVATKVDLGRQLYYDPRFSKNQDISCDTCHHLAAFGVDGEAFSTGHKSQKGGRNAPTVYNAAGQVAQYWDGRAPDVEKQALGPMLNPVEMAMKDANAVLAVIRSMPDYVSEFEKAFPDDKDPVTIDNLGGAIGAFERGLVTPSRWDKYLKGDKTALVDAEKKGARLFMETGCAACHNGAYVGGATFQKLGVLVPWPNQKDQGRFEATKQEADKMMFKVPSLRNIAMTGPYFHDASARALRDPIILMARHQLGKELAASDVRSIAVFLCALTGVVPADYVKEPTLPKSTSNTPKPDPA